MAESWFLLPSGPGAPAENMAWDEALLRSVARLGQPVLRFYGWTEPAASFGYFQHYAEVETWTPLRPLIRRPTGGGLVPHAADWTYSLVFPPTHAWFHLRAEESYRHLHEWIQDSFARVKLPAELAPRGAKTAPGQCFAGPEKSDLVWNGGKIAGAAQRRTRGGMLIQGSIQPLPPGVERGAWERALLEAARERFALSWKSLEPGAWLQQLAVRLGAEKYSQAAFNRRR